MRREFLFGIVELLMLVIYVFRFFCWFLVVVDLFVWKYVLFFYNFVVKIKKVKL